MDAALRGVLDLAGDVEVLKVTQESAEEPAVDKRGGEDREAPRARL